MNSVAITATDERLVCPMPIRVSLIVWLVGICILLLFLCKGSIGIFLWLAWPGLLTKGSSVTVKGSGGYGQKEIFEADILWK
jgi:hypothetical protein